MRRCFVSSVMFAPQSFFSLDLKMSVLIDVKSKLNIKKQMKVGSELAAACLIYPFDDKCIL